MFCLQCRNLSYTYPGSSEPVFHHVDLDFSAGDRTALIGRNGTGKTTLIRILLGELPEYHGDLVWPRTRPAVGYLPQNFALSDELSVTGYCYQAFPELSDQYRRLGEYAAREADLSPTEAIAYAEALAEWYAGNGPDLDREIRDLLIFVGLENHAETPCSRLSGGEKTRLALGAILLRHPDILILDEPTNHLDRGMLEWLEGFVRDFPGAVLYVSHDREFIDRTATRIVELARGEATTRNGNYSVVKQQLCAEHAHQMGQYEERQKLLGRLQTAAQKRRQWAGTFQRQTTAEGGGFVYESVYNAARTMMQQAQHIEERMKMLNERHPVDKPWQDKARSIRFTPQGAPSETVLTIKDLTFAYSDTPVLRDFGLLLQRGERVHLQGANGSGKTTLLQLIMGRMQPQEGTILLGSRVRIGYYDQEFRQLPPDVTALTHLRTISPDDQRIRTLSGCLGAERETLLQRIGSLSEGEKAKIALTALLLGDANLLLLDEPTNHLDIVAREMLEQALLNFGGTLLFVSHDRRFIDQVATRTVELL